jgi:hypothetical protein
VVKFQKNKKGRAFCALPILARQALFAKLQKRLPSISYFLASLNAVFIPGAHLFYFLWHIMQVTGI